jgi:hypothetical protein
VSCSGGHLGPWPSMVQNLHGLPGGSPETALSLGPWGQADIVLACKDHGPRCPGPLSTLPLQAPWQDPPGQSNRGPQGHSAFCHCDKIPEQIHSKEQRSVSARGFRGFCPWSAGSSDLGLTGGQASWQKGRGMLLMAAGKQKELKKRQRTRLIPATQFLQSGNGE